MTTSTLFESNPRDYALMLIDEGWLSREYMLLACLKAMSHDDVRSMLDTHEVSPRFIDTE